MSAPRLVVCGLEPGPAVARLPARCSPPSPTSAPSAPSSSAPISPSGGCSMRRLARAPRVLDPRLVDDAVAGELYDAWSRTPTSRRSSPSSRRSTAGRASRGRGRWTWPPHSTLRSCSSSTPASGAPRPRRLPAGCACWPGTSSTPAPSSSAARTRVRRASCVASWKTPPSSPCWGWLPPQLSEQFARQYGGSQPQHGSLAVFRGCGAGPRRRPGRRRRRRWSRRTRRRRPARARRRRPLRRWRPARGRRRRARAGRPAPPRRPPRVSL